ncbi:MAG: arginine repressor [Bdellovibrionota bacterium]
MPKSRLAALRKLLSQERASTQDELREQLEKLDFEVTQSTISRDLRKIGAIKAIDPDGRTVYRLPEESLAPITASSMRELVLDIQSNGYLIVIHTTPGSASLVARQLDQVAPENILGTIAGDDTVFVAPASLKETKSAIRLIEDALSE